MPFDPTIALQAQTPPMIDPYKSMMQVQTLRDMAQQRQLRQAQMQEVQAVTAKRQKDEADDQRAEEITSQHPPTPIYHPDHGPDDTNPLIISHDVTPTVDALEKAGLPKHAREMLLHGSALLEQGQKVQASYDAEKARDLQSLLQLGQSVAANPNQKDYASFRAKLGAASAKHKLGIDTSEIPTMLNNPDPNNPESAGGISGLDYLKKITDEDKGSLTMLATTAAQRAELRSKAAETRLKDAQAKKAESEAGYTMTPDQSKAHLLAAFGDENDERYKDYAGRIDALPADAPPKAALGILKLADDEVSRTRRSVATNTKLQEQKRAEDAYAVEVAKKTPGSLTPDEKVRATAWYKEQLPAQVTDYQRKVKLATENPELYALVTGHQVTNGNKALTDVQRATFLARIDSDAARQQLQGDELTQYKKDRIDALKTFGLDLTKAAPVKAPTVLPHAGKTATKAQVQAAATKNGITYDEAKKRVEAAGGTVTDDRPPLTSFEKP